MALDLEGTLITTVVSILPRPGLYRFLEYCRERFRRIVIMTAVDRETFEETRAYLLEKAYVPDWFADVEYIDYHDSRLSNYGQYKDLRCIPYCDDSEALIIDDMESYIRPNQKDRWIDIEAYWGARIDREFERVMKIVR